MTLQNKAIESVCILRLSALGDVTHMIPVIKSIHKYKPDIKVTWIIGTTEYKLVGDLPNVEFIQFDKKKGIRAYSEISKKLSSRKFDVLLAMQVSLRANILSSLIKASRKIGYDDARAKDLHSLFIKEKIEPRREHVVDAFFQFIEHIGIAHRLLDWSLPIPEEAHQFAQQHLAEHETIFAISPCSSHELRNWTVDHYVEVANYAAEKHNMTILLLGGNTELEQDFGKKITRQLTSKPINLIGKDTLKKLLAVLQRSTILLSPDSGPAHMATCVDTPVIGLYATSNSQRSGPYLSRQHCIDKYSEAAELVYKKSSETIKWGTKLEKPGVMELIKPNDVIIKIDAIMLSIS